MCLGFVEPTAAGRAACRFLFKDMGRLRASHSKRQFHLFNQPAYVRIPRGLSSHSAFGFSANNQILIERNKASTLCIRAAEFAEACALCYEKIAFILEISFR
jgi:hypothetical protein